MHVNIPKYMLYVSGCVYIHNEYPQYTCIYSVNIFLFLEAIFAILGHLKFSLRGVLTFVASGLDINGCVLSYFEGTVNLHCYTSCTSLLYIVAKWHLFKDVTWKDIIKYLQKCEGCTHFCEILQIYTVCSCGSVVEHCFSSAKGCGFNSQGTHILIIIKMYNLNPL